MNEEVTKSRKNVAIWIISIVLIVMVSVGLWLIVPSVGEEESIKIGAMLLLSGDGASWGQASQNAINLAVEEANAEGGINGKIIEVIYEDTHH